MPPADFDRFLTFSQAVGLDGQLRALGFDFITLDLRGYVSGSMDPREER